MCRCPFVNTYSYNWQRVRDMKDTSGLVAAGINQSYSKSTNVAARKPLLNGGYRHKLKLPQNDSWSHVGAILVGRRKLFNGALLITNGI